MRAVGFGDTPDEIEMSALDTAREFFGAAPQLVVLPDYAISDVPPGGALAAEAAGKKSYATVTIWAVS